jgi:anti-sigma B factor antagonist
MSDPSPPFLIRTHTGATAHTIHVSGELDHATAPQLRVALHALDGSSRLTVLDMSRVSFIDSAGLREILIAHRQAERDGHELHIAGATGSVRSLFKITALDITLHLIDPLAPTTTG